MRIMYEWRQRLWRKEDELPVIASRVTEQYNFRSVYGFPEEAQKHIEANGNTQGLDAYPVQSSTLFIDVDEDENVAEVERVINSLGVGYSKYSTGNRGMHFHVDTENLTDINLPYSHLSFVESLGILKLIDPSIYRHHSIIRVPGAVHQKTGQAKTMIERVEGVILEIPIVEKPQVDYSYDGIDGDLQALSKFQHNLLQYRGVGQRHSHLFILFTDGINAGLSTEEVLDYLYWWNSRQHKPHEEEAILKKWQSFTRQEVRRGSKRQEPARSSGILSP